MRNPDKPLPLRDALLRFFPAFDPTAAGEQHPIARLCAHIDHMSHPRYGWASTEDAFDAEMEMLCDLLDETEAPYFIRYIVSRDILVVPECFAKWSKRVQGLGIELCYGGTQDQRFWAIEPYFTGEGSALVDVGCGKGFYLLRLASRYKHVIGFEAQGMERERAAQAMAADGIEHVSLEGAFGKQLLPEHADVLLTEVVEHIPYSKAIELVQAVSRQRPRLFVITAPNREFNPHYRIEKGFRHQDHKWEPTRAEFVEFVRTATRGHALEVRFRAVGDKVQGVPTSLMAVVSC